MRFVGIAILGAAAAQAGFLPKQQPLMTTPSYDVDEMEDPQLSLAEASDADETAVSDADEISEMTDSEDQNLYDAEMETTDATEDSESNVDEEEDFDADGMDVANSDEVSDTSEDLSETEMGIFESEFSKPDVTKSCDEVIKERMDELGNIVSLKGKQSEKQASLKDSKMIRNIETCLLAMNKICAKHKITQSGTQSTGFHTVQNMCRKEQVKKRKTIVLEWKTLKKKHDTNKLSSVLLDGKKAAILDTNKLSSVLLDWKKAAIFCKQIEENLKKTDLKKKSAYVAQVEQNVAEKEGREQVMEIVKRAWKKLDKKVVTAKKKKKAVKKKAEKKKARKGKKAVKKAKVSVHR